MQEEWQQYFVSKFAELSDDAFCAKISKMWGGLPYVTQKKLDGLEATLLDSLAGQGDERTALARVFKKHDSNSDGMLQFDEFERRARHGKRRPHVALKCAISSLPMGRSPVWGLSNGPGACLVQSGLSRHLVSSASRWRKCERSSSATTLTTVTRWHLQSFRPQC